MFINLNWSTMGIAEPATIEALADLAVRHGYGGVDLPRHAYASSEAADHARAVIEKAGLRWGLFRLPGSFLDSDEAKFAAEMEQLAAVAPLVARAGCRATYQHVWPASDTLDYAANAAAHVSKLHRMMAVLDPHGIRMGLEFIGGTEKRRGHRHEFAYTLPQILALANAAGPGVGLIIDAYHWWTSGGTLDEVRQLPDIGRIINVHLSDGVAGVPRDEQLDLVRAMPASTGLVDIPGLLSILRDRGYDGPVICEPFDPARKQFTAMPPDAVAGEVMRVMGPLVFPAA
ncbi:MAG: Xylose isomerase domain protein barrel [Phycisphaerales bacterium]|nr:Xylose isomerase domain protein barrel [Phycisphaerales bacterium]